MKKLPNLEAQHQQLQAQHEQLLRAFEQKEAELLAKEQHIIEQKAQIEYLTERLNILLAKRFKAQSEQLKYLQGQLFDEAELDQAIRETQEALDALKRPSPADRPAPPPAKPAAKPKRKPLPDHLRRVEVIVDVSDEDKQAMGEDWCCIGYESSEQLAVQQRQYYVKVIKRKKYVRNSPPADLDQACEAGIRLASPPRVMLPRSIADASLLADVLCSKFIDAMSFYRTEKRLERDGIEIGYSTICDWPQQLYEHLKPFERLFYESLAQCQLWQLDETTLQVLGEPGRLAQQVSYLWGVRTGPPDPPMVLFHYSTRRNIEALEQWLAPSLPDFRGAIITDEHGAYNTLVAHHPSIHAHGGCLAHCRRKFADAAKGRRHGSDAHRVLQKIALIYRREKTTAPLCGQARIDALQERVAPLMRDLKALLEQLAPRYLEKGAMKLAIGYALNNWAKFTAFLEHPALPIDNNAMEQAIRPFTLGRKNWLFAGSPRGAQASAFIYSLVESAKANDLEPWWYLNTLFERYPLARNDDERRLLLPWNLKNSAAGQQG